MTDTEKEYSLLEKFYLLYKEGLIQNDPAGGLTENLETRINNRWKIYKNTIQKNTWDIREDKKGTRGQTDER